MTGNDDRPRPIDIVRQRCRPEHDRLEHALSAFGWLETPERYAAALERFAGLHAGLDDLLLCAAGELDGLDVRPRLKLPLLEADLAALGSAPGSAAVRSRASTHPRPDRIAALGTLYVTEGATLGGKLIRREVRRRLGADAPTAFFGAYDRDAARRWREFETYLNAAVGDDDEAERIAQAALQTMQVYAAWLAPLAVTGDDQSARGNASSLSGRGPA